MSPAEIELAKQIQSALRVCPHLAARNLQFEAEEGRVTLHGEVGSFFQKQMAQEALRSVHGIQRIENELQVTWQ